MPVKLKIFQVTPESSGFVPVVPFTHHQLQPPTPNYPISKKCLWVCCKNTGICAAVKSFFYCNLRASKASDYTRCILVWCRHKILEDFKTDLLKQCCRLDLSGLYSLVCQVSATWLSNCPPPSLSFWDSRNPQKRHIQGPPHHLLCELGWQQVGMFKHLIIWKKNNLLFQFPPSLLKTIVSWASGWVKGSSSWFVFCRQACFGSPFLWTPTCVLLS